MSNAEIAATFGISAEAVKDHLANILEKTGATTRLELAMLAMRHDLLHEK